ncbi:hypothetical protein Q9L58_008051 [Maublancomyces gigas]|uniref:Uncharacterized protein n=1 Tax=Discina gigas TaxID=1032678 RepID=A0ABR3GBV0_9PEZI
MPKLIDLATESSVYPKGESGLESDAYDARNTVTSVLKIARKPRRSSEVTNMKSRNSEVSMRSRNPEAINMLPILSKGLIYPA